MIASVTEFATQSTPSHLLCRIRSRRFLRLPPSRDLDAQQLWQPVPDVFVFLPTAFFDHGRACQTKFDRCAIQEDLAAWERAAVQEDVDVVLKIKQHVAESFPTRGPRLALRGDRGFESWQCRGEGSRAEAGLAVEAGGEVVGRQMLLRTVVQSDSVPDALVTMYIHTDACNKRSWKDRELPRHSAEVDCAHVLYLVPGGRAAEV